ncbi:MAG: hypothetical protein DCC58_13200 [Chloroflexi bacterium]|nr:MAG: hypothetical protein DCC58_13200 [Chloroflexota bacterium]
MEQQHARAEMITTMNTHSPSQPETGYIDVTGGRLYYEAAGSGPTLVLLHAGIADLRLWEPQWQDFCSHYHVVRYDLRGYGRSTSEPLPYANEEDLHALFQALGIARAHLLGASFGGRVAIDFALQYPALVDGLVLLAPALGGYPLSGALDAADAAIEAAFAAGDFVRAAEIDLEVWLAGPRRNLADLPAALRATAHTLAEGVYQAAAAHGAPGQLQRLEPPAMRRLERLLAPTLLLVGAEDQPDMLAIAGTLEARVGELQRITLPDTGHLPNLERPLETTAAVLAFLQRLDASAVELRPLTADNWEAAVNLRVADDQSALLESNAVSIAESRFHPWMLPLALYHEEEMVGFTMFSQYPDPREGHHWVHRFMIDRRHQGRGFGRAGMRAVVQYMAAIPGCDEIWIGYDRDNRAAARLYRAVGFRETGPAPWEGRDLAAVRKLTA